LDYTEKAVKRIGKCDFFNQFGGVAFAAGFPSPLFRQALGPNCAPAEQSDRIPAMCQPGRACPLCSSIELSELETPIAECAGTAEAFQCNGCGAVFTLYPVVGDHAKNAEAKKKQTGGEVRRRGGIKS
jgi:hypothetical protein